ncbi:MAG: pilus assembly FimT family protein [Zoogloea sp.]|uniref:pilus assembly FimT family protein n=1 Tax=Zoogloea sp. TaxID=49181 RepID=UPI003F402D94|nr:hypothetical protein [Rhodocyclales bacterium]
MGRRDGRGYTLLELVAVMLLTATLAVVILPRFADQTSFASRGYADTLKASLQHVRRTAIAQRRTACVSLSGSVLSMRISSAPASASCDLPLADPVGGGALSLSPPNGVSIRMSPASFSFDPQGRPSAAVSFAIGGSPARTLVVEAESGHVH